MSIQVNLQTHFTINSQSNQFQIQDSRQHLEFTFVQRSNKSNITGSTCLFNNKNQWLITCWNQINFHPDKSQAWICRIFYIPNEPKANTSQLIILAKSSPVFLSSWQRSYNLALCGPNSCVRSMTKGLVWSDEGQLMVVELREEDLNGSWRREQ